MYNTILALILAYGTKGAVPAKKLAAEILLQSSIYKVDPVHVTKVMLVESRGLEYAYNVRSGDHGLMQINYVVAEEMGVSSECLYHWKCNLKTGIRVLVRKRNYRACSYNLGAAGSLDKRKETKCLTYEAKLAKINLGGKK